ncbi:probable RNA-directed DNA polymerase from transposon X-element [Trichonephila clavipes]|nr:probable RNA-directed DNA polymerase from transposon X-element [Trichonephila clavipes]
MLVSNGVSVNTIPDIANTHAETFAKTSSCDNYTPAFQALKRQEERVKLNFSSSNEEGYNSPLTLLGLRTALHRLGNTAAGPDGLHYIMLRHLSKSSILSLLALFNRIWETQVFPTQWCHAHILPFPKPGKDPTSANNYRPIALTSCLSKLMERIFSARLMFHLESHNLFSPLQNGFRKSRSTTDNLLRLETSIRDAFVKKQYNISVFFDIKKAYDMSWRYGILRDLCAMDIRGNLPVFIKNFLNHRSFQIPSSFKRSQNQKCQGPKHPQSISKYALLRVHTEHCTWKPESFFSNYVPIFTDGSKSESHVGSSVVSLSTVITGALPISASIYTAELHALRIALEHISLSCGKKFIIYTDSQSALQGIVSLHSLSHPILVHITYALANHLKKKDIRFCWIPGHARITGNELADTAVRSTTGSSERFPIPHPDLKACFRLKLQSVWQSNWDQQTENKLHSIMPGLAATAPSSSNRLCMSWLNSKNSLISCG